jgi:hypothetical protein
MLRLRLTLQPDGLYGGAVEFNPILHAGGTWRGARFLRKTGVYTHPNMSYDVELPAAALADAPDPTLWLSMMAKTTDSGIADINKREKGYALRDQEAGSGFVPMDTLLKTGNARLALIEPLVYRESKQHVTREIKAESLARKGWIDVSVLSAPSPLPSLRRGFFGTPRYMDMGAKVMNLLEGHYLRFCTTLDIPADSGLAAPPLRFAHAPENPLSEHLHAARLETRVGSLPAVAYMMQDGRLQSRSIREEVAQLRQQLGPKHVEELKAQLDSALLARGMRRSEFIKVVREQHARKDDILLGGYLTALSVAIFMATSTVTSVQYKTDGRIPNPHAVATDLTRAERESMQLPEPTQTPFLAAVWATARRIVQASKQQRGKLAAKRHPFFDASAPLGATSSSSSSSSTRSPFIQGDDWGFGVLSGATNSDDCETVAMAAILMLETNYQVLRDLHTSVLTEDLGALREILTKHVPVFAAGTVTEPYVETGAKSTDKPMHPPLPCRGSPAAAKWPSAGHGYGLFIAQALLDHLQYQGMDRYDALHPDDRVTVAAKLSQRLAAVAPWERKVPVGMIEGTGLVWPYTANAEEVWVQTADRADVGTKKSAASIAFARAIKAKGWGPLANLQEDADLATLNALLRVESQPYEVHARAKDTQWISGFYNATVHLFSPRTYAELAPTLAPMLLIDTRTHTRGVDHATLSTPETAWAHMAAFPHYGDAISVAQWNAEVEPYLHMALEQLPLSAYLASPDQHPVRAVARSSPSQTLATPVPLATAQAFARVETSHHSADRTTLVTTVDPRQFKADATAHDRLVEALNRLVAKGRLAQYTWLHERPLDQCHETLQLTLAIPVPDQVDTALFPSPPPVAE